MTSADDLKQDIKTNEDSHVIREITEDNVIEMDATVDVDALININIDQNSYHLSGRKEGQYNRDTPYFIEIHPVNHYKISWSYRCEDKCKFYQYIRCYDKRFREIESMDILRNGEPVIIKNIDNDDVTIHCKGNLKNWYKPNAGISCRNIGFYYSGHGIYERLYADNYIKWVGDYRKHDVDKGAYCNIDINNNTIKLSEKIPKSIKDKIVLNKTVIRNHWASSTFIYPFSHSSQLIIKDNKWHKSEYIIKGSAKTFGATIDKFRKGTKYIKLGIYCNRGADIWFNRLKFELNPIQ